LNEIINRNQATHIDLVNCRRRRAIVNPFQSTLKLGSSLFSKRVLNRVRNQNQMSNQDARASQTESAPSGKYGNRSAGEVENVNESRAEVAKLSFQISEQTRFFDAILSSISDFAYVFNADGRFVFINQSLLDLWGLKADDAVGKNFFDLNYPEELAGRLQRQIQQVFETRARVTDETPYTSPTGVMGYYEYIFSPFFGADGLVELVVGTTRNVTTRKQAEEEIKQLSERNRNILESITEAFFAVDGDWRFTYVNPQAERLLERMPGDLVGKLIWDEFPGLAGSKFQEAYYQAAYDRTASSVTAFYPDHQRWYEVNSFPATNGITIYFRNVTERVRVEEALKDSNRRKDEFLATLAHELRNPLAPICSGLEIIRRMGDDQGELERTVDIVQRQTDQLVHLVDDLLDISRISHGKIHLRTERIQLKTAIEIALESSQGLIDEAANELTVTLPAKPIYIDGDLTRVAQIFLNILNNAAKFSEKGGTISLAAERHGDKAVISIKDSGLGIPPEMLNRIFDMFGQIETPNEEAKGGLGIGLSVVRKLVEMHGGSVEAFSEGQGKGSEFLVTLPLATEQAEAKATYSSTEEVVIQSAQLRIPDNPNASTCHSQAIGRRILVVDDNDDAAVMLATLLSMEGHSVRIAHDGKAALEVADEFQPEVCLCDIGLPEMNGYEVASRLRSRFPDSLLISVSGWGREEDRLRSQDAGFAYHLVKPVEFDDLMTLIHGRFSTSAEPS
jgi:PAS domain S-box-containing protein